MIKNRKALSLLEMLIAISFIFIIVLVGTTFLLYALNLIDIFRAQSNSFARPQFIMEHIMKNLRDAVDISLQEGGSFQGERGFYPTGIEPRQLPVAGPLPENYLFIRKANGTFDDPSDDYWSAYAFDNRTLLPGYGDNQVHYYPNFDLASGFPPTGDDDEILLGEVQGLWFSKYEVPPNEVSDAGFLSDDTLRNVVTITISHLNNLNEPEGLENPKIVLRSTFISRAMTTQTK